MPAQASASPRNWPAPKGEPAEHGTAQPERVGAALLSAAGVAVVGILVCLFFPMPFRLFAMVVTAVAIRSAYLRHARPIRLPGSILLVGIVIAFVLLVVFGSLAFSL